MDQNLFSPVDRVNSFTQLPGYGSFTLNHGQNAGLEWTRVFHSKLLNEFRLGFIRMRATVLQQNHETDFNAALGFPDLGASNFGEIVSANSYGNKPPRQIQLSTRYVF